MAKGHTLYSNADGASRPDAVVDRNGDTALGLCKVCGAGEIELDEPCADRIERLSRERADWDGVYAHSLDIDAEYAGK